MTSTVIEVNIENDQLYFVKDHQRYVIAKDAFVTTYKGGETLVPCDRESLQSIEIECESANDLYFLVPCESLRGSDVMPSIVGIRGHYFDDDAIAKVDSN